MVIVYFSVRECVVIILLVTCYNIFAWSHTVHWSARTYKDQLWYNIHLVQLHFFLKVSLHVRQYTESHCFQTTMENTTVLNNFIMWKLNIFVFVTVRCLCPVLWLLTDHLRCTHGIWFVIFFHYSEVYSQYLFFFFSTTMNFSLFYDCN